MSHGTGAAGAGGGGGTAARRGLAPVIGLPAHAPARAWRENWAMEALPIVRRFAADHNLTSREYQRVVRAKMAEVLDGTQVYTRRTSNTAEKILQEGRFKTRFQTESMAHDPYLHERLAMERAMYGGATKVVYGYAAHPEMASRVNKDYGDAVFRLKPAAAHGATMTFGDSLSEWGRRIPTQLARPGIHSWNWVSNQRSDRDPMRLLTPEFASRHAEVQIHHGLSADDIAHVTWTGGHQPSAATIAAMRRRGITWDVTP